MAAKHNTGIEIDNQTDDMFTFLKIIILLYADDTVILSDDAMSFQKCLDNFNEYCQIWKLKINVSKSKVLIFGCRNCNAFEFTIGDQTLELVDKYKYLGLYFTKMVAF